jgi:ribosomal protein S18 acetylase RimI-like enzyme
MSQNIKIIDYTPKYQKDFRDLNVEWISKYFVMEPSDYKALDNPQTYIIDKGGHIFIALLDDEPVGACALVKMDDPDFDYELAKMAVSPKAQGNKIGWMLGCAILEKAKSLGGKNIFIESNTILTPAINLYYKLGFVQINNRPSPYIRSNIQLACNL